MFFRSKSTPLTSHNHKTFYKWIHSIPCFLTQHWTYHYPTLSRPTIVYLTTTKSHTWSGWHFTRGQWGFVSSDLSTQSTVPSQKRAFAIQVPSKQVNWLSVHLVLGHPISSLPSSQSSWVSHLYEWGMQCHVLLHLKRSLAHTCLPRRIITWVILH